MRILAGTLPILGTRRWGFLLSLVVVGSFALAGVGFGAFVCWLLMIMVWWGWLRMGSVSLPCGVAGFCVFFCQGIVGNANDTDQGYRK